MEDESSFNSTGTSDSAGGVHIIGAKRWRMFRRTEIVLRHAWGQRWCSAGGAWVNERQRAVHFATNLDALVYCQAMGLCGVVVAFDQNGAQLYELNVERVLDAIAGDPHTHSGATGGLRSDWGHPVDPPRA